MTITNPNGANQFVEDARQAAFLKAYFDSDSETYCNGLQSALSAGYAREYAEKITSAMPKWLSERVKHSKLLNQAEKNLDSFLSLDESDNGKLKVKYQATAFTLERLDRKHYGVKQEIDITSDGATFAGFKYTNPVDITAQNVTGLTELNDSQENQQTITESLLNAA